MQSLFDKILVPVDFSLGSDIAIKKATELVNTQHSQICLLHIMKPLFSFSIFSSVNYIVAPPSEILTESEIERKMMEYKAIIKRSVPGAKVEYVVDNPGVVQRKIIQFAKSFVPELIILCKNSNGHLFSFANAVSPLAIAKKTNCAVLTIKPGSSIRKIKNIVLPVNEFVPERKLDVAIGLARKFNAKVHIVAFPGEFKKDERKEHAFLESFHKIKQIIPLMVQHGPLKGRGIAKAVLQYAKRINADMILANPQTESSFSSFTGKRHLSDMLLVDSPIQIMDVKPYSQIN